MQANPTQMFTFAEGYYRLTYGIVPNSDVEAETYFVSSLNPGLPIEGSKLSLSGNSSMQTISTIYYVPVSTQVSFQINYNVGPDGGSLSLAASSPNTGAVFFFEMEYLGSGL